MKYTFTLKKTTIGKTVYYPQNRQTIKTLHLSTLRD